MTQREDFEAWYVKTYPFSSTMPGKFDREGGYYTDTTVNVAWQAFQFAQAAQPAQPEGWLLVPVEPTQAMCQEGQWKAQEWPKFPLRISPIYKAMLSAAPSRIDVPWKTSDTPFVHHNPFPAAPSTKEDV